MLRFPADFVFQLSREEFDSLRSLFQQVKLIHSRGSMDNLTHFDVSGILETWKFPLRVLKILNDLNGAQRWNDWNNWNGPRCYVSAAIERLERSAAMELLERLEHLKRNQSDKRFERSEAVERLEPLERTDPTSLLEHTHKHGIASTVAPVMMHDAATLMHIQEFMKAVTLRSLPPDVAEAIRKEANRKGMSLNKAVISLLGNRVSVREKKKSRQTRHHDLDELAGSWSKKEAAEFDKSLADQRTIDPDLWK